MHSIKSFWGRSALTFTVLLLRFLWRKKDFILRVFAGWIIGVSFLLVDQQSDFDTRLQMRGLQPIDDRIVLIHLDRHLFPHQENPQIFASDQTYWSASLWSTLLSKILAEDPLSVTVAFFFNSSELKQENLSAFIFNNPKVLWAAQFDPDGRVMAPPFAKISSRQTGINEFQADRDGLIRRLIYKGKPILHITKQTLLNANFQFSDPSADSRQSNLINFRGPSGRYPTYSALDILQKNINTAVLKNKIVLIGASDLPNHIVSTPLGRMTKTEVHANIIDTMINHRWLKTLMPIESILLLFIFVLLTALLTSYYPQLLVLFISIVFFVAYAGLSAFLFDQFYFWLPVLPVLIAILATAVIFISFQLTLKDYNNMQLEKEKKYMISVEELKNNFMSLISHDLKTPLAKIQSICDRLLVTHSNDSLSKDIYALKSEASELHRYIQTLLQMTRVESKDFKINRQSVDMNELIEDVVMRLRSLAESKSIVLEMHLEPMFLVEVDPVLMSEVLLNLIENAIQYTPHQGQVKVSSKDIGTDILVTVEDTGPGIPEAEQNAVFEKFFRGKHGLNKPKGSGLGLYLVKYFIELHKGDVFIDSHFEKGTRIGFRLPVSEVADDKNLISENSNEL